MEPLIDRLPALAAELVALNVSVIVTSTPQTAKALGLMIPQSLLLRADQVIEKLGYTRVRSHSEVKR